jgi:hypothetical protein
LAKEGFIEGCDRTQLDRVQYALSQSLKVLTRARRAGTSFKDLKVAFVLDKTLSGDELASMTERVETFRPAIGRRLQDLAKLEYNFEGQTVFINKPGGPVNLSDFQKRPAGEGGEHG